MTYKISCIKSYVDTKRLLFIFNCVALEIMAYMWNSCTDHKGNFFSSCNKNEHN